MTAKNSTLTAERLRELLDYDSISGRFIWRKNLKGGVRAGDSAGCNSQHGAKIVYKKIRVDGVLYYAHRLAFLHVHGRWPEGQVDHVDHSNGHSNSFVNLRECSHSQNLSNARLRFDNTTGFKGIRRRSKGCWIAQMSVDGKNTYIGAFKTAELAAAAYDKAIVERSGDFALTNSKLGLI